MALGHEGKRRLLSGHYLFDAMPDALLDRVLACTREQRFASRQAIFHKGDPGGSMLFVLQGAVRISVYSHQGREIVLEMIEPGQFLGEITLLGGGERAANATAVGDCVVLIIERADFVALVQEHPEIALRLMAVLCRRLRDAAELAECIAFLDLPARLARLLVTLARHHGRDTPEGVRIDRHLSQRDLGNIIAANRENVNRQMRAWVAEGLITAEGGTIVLRKPKALEALGQIGTI